MLATYICQLHPNTILLELVTDMAETVQGLQEHRVVFAKLVTGKKSFVTSLNHLSTMSNGKAMRMGCVDINCFRK